MLYRQDIDALKGIAILAIVLFHIGLLRSGYLGVDVFFVVSGFLLIPRMCGEMVDGRFRYFHFMGKRIVRLLPLVVIASLVCMLVGLLGMLPDSYENLAESVVASNLFSENILAAITTGNYWDISNDYKPLMHLWFVGVLFEFYLLLPILLMGGLWLLKKISRKEPTLELAEMVLGVLFVISFVLYLLPFASAAQKFYYVPFRAFELLLGGMVGLAWGPAAAQAACEQPAAARPQAHYQTITFVLLLFVLFSSVVLLSPETIGTQIVPKGAAGSSATGLIQGKSALLLLTVFLTAFLLRAPFLGDSAATSALAFVGRRSYSIFVWHQVILAFYRYFFSKDLSLAFVLLFLVAVFVVSELSFRFVESKVRLSRCSLILWTVAALLMAGWGLGVYLHAGVVRDVPELDITVGDAHRGMHAEYVERVYGYDKDFPSENGKPNVLVEGVSFGRDFANCLLESAWADSVNLSYVFRWDEQCIGRIRAADYIFTFMGRDELPVYVIDNMSDSCEIWGIGTKNYGECNGVFYRHRFVDGYKDSSVALPASYVALNQRWEKQWGSNYIDFIRMAEVSPGVVRVFTPEGRFISQDCLHLTKAGALWYASIIPWESIFR